MTVTQLYLNTSLQHPPVPVPSRTWPALEWVLPPALLIMNKTPVLIAFLRISWLLQYSKETCPIPLYLVCATSGSAVVVNSSYVMNSAFFDGLYLEPFECVHPNTGNSLVMWMVQRFTKGIVSCSLHAQFVFTWDSTKREGKGGSQGRNSVTRRTRVGRQ